jgi:peptidyl-prolyl cis-trans isomerase SurA
MKQILVGLTAFAVIGPAGARPLAQSAQTPPVQLVATPAPPDAAPVVHGQIIQRILVKVNGEIFTQRDLEDRQIEELQNLNKQVANPQDLQNDATLQKLLLEITPKILIVAIDDLIIIQRAHELGLKVSEQQYKDAIDGLKRDNKLDDAQFAKALEQQGLTMDQLRQQIEHAALLQMIQSQEIMSHVAMTEEETRQYYDKHQGEFLSAPAITLREILITAAPGPSTSGLSFAGSSDGASKARIQEALDRVRKGENFAAVATDVSDAPSKARGGLMTPVPLDDLAPAVRDATDKLKAGDVTDVIKTQRGYQIFKVEARTAQSVLPFEQVKQTIQQKIFEQRRDGETKKYVERLRGQALIEWKDDGLKKLYETSLTKPK